MEDAATLASTHLSRYDALLRVSKILAGHRTLGELFRVLADELHSVVPFDYLALVLHDDATDEMRLVVLEPSDLTPPAAALPVAERGPAAIVWETQKGAVIMIPEHGPLPRALEFIRSHGRKATCWLPLTTAHRRVGVLSFGSSAASAYDDDVLAFMEQVAAMVAVAVDNGINYEDAQRYQRELEDERDHLQFLLSVNNLLVSHLDYRELLKSISEAVRQVIDANSIGVALFHRDSGQLRLDWIYDQARGFTQSDTVLPLDRSVAGVTFQRGVAGVFRRAELEAVGWESAALMKAEGVESVCCVPLVTRTGTFGALYVGSVSPNGFSEDDVTMLGQTSVQIALALENALAYGTLTHINARLLDEKQYLERELHDQFSDIIGTSPPLRRVLKAIKTVAAADSTVLLLGETGTGKELVARAIHSLSPRSERTFVRMNVAAVPQALFESELFGHERGAFTGATASRIGRLELANRGTLFLDEVGDIPPEVQPKLLRALQEREFERLGSTRTQRVDVRVVAATNRDLEHMVEDGTFRSDLYYRLSVFPIVIPPLRDRIDDLPALATRFARQCARRLGRPAPTIPPATMNALKRWSWPGNIRELQNVIERAVIQSVDSRLEVSLHDLQPRYRPGGTKPRPAAAPSPVTTLHDAEREAILRALRDSGGVIAGPTGAAARLGLRRTTLHSKMQRLGIQRPSY
jgi:formate hydrogenlyase transcriptional activator